MAQTDLYLSLEPRSYFEHKYCSRQNNGMQNRRLQLVHMSFPSNVSLKADGDWNLRLSSRECHSIHPTYSRRNTFICQSFLQPVNGNGVPALKGASVVLKWSFDAFSGSTILKLIPAVGVVAFAAWGLGPLVQLIRANFLYRYDSSWEKSSTHYITTSYVQPLLMWTGVALICRMLDPVVLQTEASQAVKLRVLNFARSLSTVLAFAHCLSRLTQQAQKFFVERNDASDPGIGNIGFSFAGKAVYSAVWVATLSLSMELLGFSTQKWLTAGGLLLTLAGREIFTNFLSSVMIHATRPFVVNERIQTKINGNEVSGTVEHVGWWSPTIIRGDDREAVHIPNHKFTVSVVRNISNKTHWRIKTHLAISHLDADKINSIVADMRKVLGKNPQIEQQRLHRRVFLEKINPENQSLMILVSCFVKTSHAEEYLCVKEAVLLDLVRVISHHRARLATPIRTVQNIYNDDEDLENVPFDEEGIFYSSPRGAANRPILLMEPSHKVHGDEKSKGPPSPRNKGKAAASSTNLKDKSRDASKEMLRSSLSSNPKGAAPVGEVFVESGSGKADKDGKKRMVSPRQFPSMLPLEENIVLNVALEGSKRTLPIEEETVPSSVSAESKELTPQCSGSRSPSKPSRIDKKDSHVSGSS